MASQGTTTKHYTLMQYYYYYYYTLAIENSATAPFSLAKTKFMPSQLFNADSQSAVC